MAQSSSEFRALLHRYQLGQCTPAETRRIEEWYRRLGSGASLDLTPDEKAELLAVVWQRIASQTTARAGQATLPASRWLTGTAADVRWAAVAVLALGVGLVGVRVWQGPLGGATGETAKNAVAAPAAAWRVYANPSGREVRVALPDGSAVALAPASTLRYRLEAGGNRRLAYLVGAASFDVFHDERHPFSVFTDQMVTTVLGTSFRVRAYAGQAEAQVQVRTGAVRVSRREAGVAVGAGSVVVLPNQQAVYSPGRRQLRRELVAQPALLAPQSFVFDDRPVAEVLAALEKAYGVAIVHDAAALRHCTLNLSLGRESLYAKLDIICEALGASYEKVDGRILFHSPPCSAE